MRDHQQPMLISKNKKSARQFSGEDILIYLVPELCIMTGITEAMRYISLLFLFLKYSFFVFKLQK